MHALINGGAPYLILDAAYPNIDGAFEDVEKISLDEQIERCELVSSLHERVAACEMIFHELLNQDGSRQRSIFADGTEVVVDFERQNFEIRMSPHPLLILKKVLV